MEGIIPHLSLKDIPVETWICSEAEQNQLDISVLRLDLVHPWIQGNKWFKLLPFAEKCLDLNMEGFVSMGGPFSNHLIALSCAAFELGKRSVFFIRGGETEWVDNPAIGRMKAWGADIRPLDRKLFRDLHQQGPDTRLLAGLENFLWVPMGASSPGYASALHDLGQHISQTIPFDWLALPAATGGTAAGIASGLAAGKKMLVTEVLKSQGSLETEFRKSGQQLPETEWITEYHFGGYAKTNPELKRFCRQINTAQSFAIEPIYSGKCFFAVSDLAQKGHFEKEKRILILHTGGIFPWNNEISG